MGHAKVDSTTRSGSSAPVGVREKVKKSKVPASTLRGLRMLGGLCGLQHGGVVQGEILTLQLGLQAACVMARNCAGAAAPAP